MITLFNKDLNLQFPCGSGHGISNSNKEEGTSKESSTAATSTSYTKATPFAKDKLSLTLTSGTAMEYPVLGVRSFSSTVVRSEFNDLLFNVPSLESRFLGVEQKFNNQFTYRIDSESPKLISLTVSVSYLLGINPSYYIEAAQYENRLADYLISTLTPPFNIDFVCGGDVFHTVHIQEGYPIHTLLEKIDFELYGFGISDEEYVSDFQPDIDLNFTKDNSEYAPSGRPLSYATGSSSYFLVPASNKSQKRLYSTAVNKSQGMSGEYASMFKQLQIFAEENNYLSNEETQISIENFTNFFDLGERNNILHEVFLSNYGGTSAQIIEAKSKEIKEYIDKAFNSTNPRHVDMVPILKLVGTKVIYQLSIYYLLKLVTYNDSSDTDSMYLPSVNIAVGKHVWEVYINALKELSESESENKVSRKLWVKAFKEDPSNSKLLEKLGDRFYFDLGSIIMDVLIYPGLIDFEVSSISGQETRNVYVIKDKGLIGVSKTNAVKIVPNNLPMIVPPKDYTREESGGYLRSRFTLHDDMFTVRSDYKKPSTLVEGNDDLLDLVNKVSKTPFKINTEMLSFITSDLGSKYLVDASEVFLSKEQKSLLDKWEIKDLKSKYSQYLNQEFILSIATVYKGYSSIYFPVKLDQRGRLYCIPSYLNYQSTGLAKSLLQFSVPGVIYKGDLSSIAYLKSYGVTCYDNGLAKQSMKTKCAWVDANVDNIVNYENGILLAEAKEKELFLAFCIEYKRFNTFYNDATLSKFYTHLPIQLDATCNGFQHLSLLSKEYSLYKKLNLTNTRDRPNDFYSFLLERLDLRINEKLTQCTNPEKDYSTLLRIKSFLLNRSHVKKVIMTIPYNASTIRMVQSLEQELTFTRAVEVLPRAIDKKTGKEKRNYIIWYKNLDGNEINNQDTKEIVKLIVDIIATDFTRIHRLVEYLKSAAAVCNAMDTEIPWKLPTGLSIDMYYLETKSVTISPFPLRKTRIDLKIVNKNKLDLKKQTRALMPNLIHSLDAMSMTRLYLKFSEKYHSPQFFSIHDCFGTTCDKVDSLKSILVNVYIDVYSTNNYLDEFDQGIIHHIKHKGGIWGGEDGRTLIIPRKRVPLLIPLKNINWVKGSELSPDKKAITPLHILV